jgi:hypothetical protein
LRWYYADKDYTFNDFYNAVLEGDFEPASRVQPMQVNDSNVMKVPFQLVHKGLVRGTNESDIISKFVAAGDQSNAGTSLHNVPGSMNTSRSIRRERDAKRNETFEPRLYGIDESCDVANYSDSFEKNATLTVAENHEEKKDNDVKTTVLSTADHAVNEWVDRADSVSTRCGVDNIICPDGLKQIDDAVGAGFEWPLDDVLAAINDSFVASSGSDSDSEKDLALLCDAASTKNTFIDGSDIFPPLSWSNTSGSSSSDDTVFFQPDFLWGGSQFQRDLDFSDDSDDVQWDVGVIEKDPYELESNESDSDD